jgi:hypothetical protein
VAPPYQMCWKNADAQIDVVIPQQHPVLLAPLPITSEHAGTKVLDYHDYIHTRPNKGCTSSLTALVFRPTLCLTPGQGAVLFELAGPILTVPSQTVLTHPRPRLRHTRTASTPTYNCSRRGSLPSDSCYSFVSEQTIEHTFDMPLYVPP